MSTQVSSSLQISKAQQELDKLNLKYSSINSEAKMDKFWDDYEAISKSLGAATIFTGCFLLPVWLAYMVIGASYGGCKEIHYYNKGTRIYNKIYKLQKKIEKLKQLS